MAKNGSLKFRRGFDSLLVDCADKARAILIKVLSINSEADEAQNNYTYLPKDKEH